MIKPFENIRLKDLDKMERTGKIRQLLKWFNILPLFLLNKKVLKSEIEGVYKEINEGKNSNGERYELEKKEWETRSVLKIIELESCYLILVLYQDVLVRFDFILSKIKLTRGQRRKFKNIGLELLTKSIEKIKVLTGIEIKSKENINDVSNELIYLKDKYRENFKEDLIANDNKKKITILEYAGSFILYSNTSFIGLRNMTIPEFLALKNNANAKYKAEQKHINDINSKK